MAVNVFAEESEMGQNKVQACALVMSAAVCLLASTFFAFSYFSEPDDQSEIVLEARVNPNVACAASLVRLPGVGLGRAEAIVAYQEKFATGSAGRAFANCTDLQKVKGIGPKTVESVCEWLKFD